MSKKVKKESETKKDFKPIIIYLIWSVAQIVAGAALTTGTKDVLHSATLITGIAYVVLFVILFALYHKNMMGDFKKLELKKVALYVIVGIVLYYAAEYCMGLYENITNEENVIAMYKEMPVLMFLAVGFLGPICEEIVFRYSFSTFIKNDILFVILSSLVFALFHSGGLGNGFLIYFSMGAILAIIYLKPQKNLAASSIVHIVNNVLECIFLLF